MSRPAARAAALALLASSPMLARAEDAPPPSRQPVPCGDEVREHRLYLAPAVQFGATSQELSLDLGRAAISRHASTSSVRCIGGAWLAGGLRVAGVAHSWSPAAVHGLGYLSFGGWGWEWWASGLEVAVGGGHGGSRSYGLLQLSYVAGVTSRFQLFATFQAPVGRNVESPEWLARWLFGARFGFDLAKPRQERVTRGPAS